MPPRLFAVEESTSPETAILSPIERIAPACPKTEGAESGRYILSACLVLVTP